MGVIDIILSHYRSTFKWNDNFINCAEFVDTDFFKIISNEFDEWSYLI